LMRDRVKAISQLFRDKGMEVCTRIDLTSNSRQELLRLLRRFRSLYDIVSVKCMNQNAATIACRDRRIDVVFFDPANNRARFTHPLANLLHGTLEINLQPLLSSRNTSFNLSRIAKEASIAREHRSRVILSSGANSPLFVRGPLQLMAVGSALGLDSEQSRSAVTDVPLALIARNSFRRSRAFVEEGVTIVTPRAGD